MTAAQRRETTSRRTRYRRVFRRESPGPRGTVRPVRPRPANDQGPPPSPVNSNYEQFLSYFQWPHLHCYVM